MAVDKLVDSTQLDSDLTSVANAIRTKGGTSSQLAFPSGFVSAVQNIPTGITPTGTKSITANGTGIDVYSYQYADVAVPNSYSSSDEGKVVSNGALVAQTSDTVTANDTYDTTLIDELTVNVPTGGGGISVDDIATNTAPSGAITLGSGVTEIGENAFRSRKMITSVTGSNVAKINSNAFWSCSGMTEVFFPSCTTLITEVFRESGILALTDSHLPLVTSMVQASLGTMKNVTTVSLSSPTSLPNYCLDACSSLESVSFPNVTSIGLGCFRNCTKLTSVSFPKATTTGENAFSSCGNNADVSSITLDFPAATVIPNNSFNNMRKLTALILRHTSVVQLKNTSAFTNTPMRGYNSQNGTVYVPSALISSYQTATNWSTIYSEGHCTFVAIEGSIYE